MLAMIPPPLPPADASCKDLVPVHRGPTKASNWVIPGLLLCGDRSSLDSEQGLSSVLKAGTTTIVCLQSRQETNAAVDYKKRARAMREDVKFVEQPIPDQEVTDDALVEDLVARLLDLLAQGHILYVHCRGGHGRTGTICALLLGRIYDLRGPEAMARVQLYHDTRQKPVFCADGYQPLPDGSGCVILFPSQREQVLRILGDAEARGPPDLVRAQSSVYGAGASSYDEQSMQDWQEAAKAAADMLNAGKREKGEAAQQRKLGTAAELFWAAARLRPDFVRGYIGLARTLRSLGEFSEAREALLHGLERVPEDGALLQELQRLDEATPLLGAATATSDAGAAANETAPASNSTLSAADSDKPLQPLTWRPRVSDPRFVMLVGLPGSGKSTFAEQLLQSGRGWVRLCQDEMDGRDALENAIGRIAKDTSARLVIDRTNVKHADRKAFVGLAFDPPLAVCVHFDVSASECERRVANRTDHPTIQYGCGRAAVRSMRANFEMPLCSEGFEEVITVKNFHEGAHLLRCWGAEPPRVAPLGLMKFPTTQHVVDLAQGKGSIQSDRVMAPAEAAQFIDGSTVVTVEEKIDGVHLGISLTEDYEPRFQHGDDYVTSTTAAQWKDLDVWWESHSWAVCQLLEPEVEVLFGVWAFAANVKPSADFTAVDIYNKAKGQFVSARERDRRLDGFEIPVVPRLAERAFHGHQDLEQQLSLVGNALLQGIYLRIDESAKAGNMWLQKRGQVVKSDAPCSSNSGSGY